MLHVVSKKIKFESVQLVFDGLNAFFMGNTILSKKDA